MEYRVIEPPAHLVVDNLSARSSRALVDYGNHPAYREAVLSAGIGETFRALLRFVPAWLLIKAKRAIRYEMIPLHIRKAPGLSGLIRKVAAAMRHLFDKRLHPRGQATAAHPIQAMLQHQGCAVVLMPSESLGRVEELSRPLFADLERRRESESGIREFESSRYYANREHSAALFSAVEQVLSEAGVFASAERYLGHRVSLVDVNPQINDPTDDFWKRTFPDLALEQPRCAYFHRDASGGDIKAIIYLSDVGPLNGPFSYVLGSHRMQMSVTDDHIAEANDSNGLAGTALQERRLFAALPSRLRQKGTFGNDVLAGSDLETDLLGSMWPITGNRGSIVVFDTKGVHRGGMVVEGERRVITCVIG